MSKVISKVRCYNPYKHDTPSGNKNHLNYIARRNMAIANEKGVTTFGNIANIDVKSAPLSAIRTYVGDKSYQKTNIYRGIISLKENDALTLGYDKQEAWEELLQRKAHEIGKILGIPPLNVEWVGVVHLKKGNPHLHYMLWDKNQKINDYYISVTKQNRIRELLTKDIFYEELQQYYSLINKTKNTLRNNAMAMEIKAFDKSNCVGKLAYINFPPNIIKDLVKKFNELKNIIPKTGSLKYSYMPEETKKKINEFIKIYLDNNADFKNEYEKYIETAGKIGAMYGENSKKYYENKAKKELENILGNQFLNAIKMINNEKLQDRRFITNLMQELFRTLSIVTESNQAKYNLFTEYKGEMSKQAKKDFAKNKANASGIEWSN